VFCVWDDKGVWQGDVSRSGKLKSWVTRGKESEMAPWPTIDANKVPRACAEVPVEVNDNGTIHDTVMVAGLPAFQVESNRAGEDTLSPVSGWAMFELPRD